MCSKFVDIGIKTFSETEKSDPFQLIHFPQLALKKK